jgi:hypothetical protein
MTHTHTHNPQVPTELARSEAAKQKPGAITGKRDAIQYAKK